MDIVEREIGVLRFVIEYGLRLIIYFCVIGFLNSLSFVLTDTFEEIYEDWCGYCFLEEGSFRERKCVCVCVCVCVKFN